MTNKVKDFFCGINRRRESLEDDAANKMDKLGQNPTYIKLKNKGADELVEKGIEIGIALAASQSGLPITVDEATIDRIADKGGDGLVKIWDAVVGCIKKQLRKK